MGLINRVDRADDQHMAASESTNGIHHLFPLGFQSLMTSMVLPYLPNNHCLTKDCRLQSQVNHSCLTHKFIGLVVQQRGTHLLRFGGSPSSKKHITHHPKTTRNQLFRAFWSRKGAQPCPTWTSLAQQELQCQFPSKGETSSCAKALGIHIPGPSKGCPGRTTLHYL